LAVVFAQTGETEPPGTSLGGTGGGISSGRISSGWKSGDSSAAGDLVGEREGEREGDLGIAVKGVLASTTGEKIGDSGLVALKGAA
jgi:hypothetical protein